MPELFRCPIRLNDTQELQQQAALRLHYEGFGDAPAIIEELREPLAEIENSGVNQLGRRPELVEYNVATGLRNTLFRAMGARAAAPVIPAITMLLDGERPPEAPLSADKNMQQYNGDRDRRYNGKGAILAPIIQETLVALQTKEMATLPDKEYDSLQTAFATTTTERKAAAAKLLDAEYDTKWRTRAILQKPFEALQYPYRARRLMTNVAHISDVVETALLGTARSSAEFMSSSLIDMHAALHEADCPPPLWHRETTRHIGLLAIGSLLKDQTADRLFLRGRDAPDRVNPYKASRQKDRPLWDITPAHTIVQGHIKNGKGNNCQGTTPLPPRTETDAHHLQEYEARLSATIGYPLEADYSTRGLDAASVSAGLAIAATQFYRI